MASDVELLTQIRDLLQVIAEPQLAVRDKKMRTALREVVGASKKQQAAISLMDGSRPPAIIVKEAGIDAGQLSRLVKSLAANGLVAPDHKLPKLMVKVPPSFFDEDGSND